MAFCFSSSTAFRVRRTFHIWCRLDSSGSQNILDGSTMDAIVYGWSRSFSYFKFCQSLMPSFFRSKTYGTTAFFVQIPVIAIDSLAFGKLVIVPWNIVRYNIFGGSERGPDLYGTSPWNFYVLPLDLVSLPALGVQVTYIIDRKRLGVVSSTSNQSSPFTVLYLWLGILSLQPHKEECFMFPAYPLLCFNAAVALSPHPRVIGGFFRQSHLTG
jgi:hypothetical protein